MVLTDLPFDSGSLLLKRYNLIRDESAKSEGGEDEEKFEESKRYAAFLKEKERRVGPGGFLDSTRYSYTFTLKAADQPLTPRPPNVVSLSARLEQRDNDLEKRIKVIEDHMWQHKQEERELKRVEGDIIKKQRAVRHVLRDFENAINKKRFAEEKKLNTGLKKYTKLQIDHIHKKEMVCKQRAESSLGKQIEAKHKGRQAYLKESGLLQRYRAKMGALELKKNEVLHLGSEFENQLRTKEIEQHRLAQELVDLSTTLNMEAQKGRVQKAEMLCEQKKDSAQKIQDDLNSERDLEKKLGQGDTEIKTSEMMKSRLAADLALTKAHLDIKKRDAASPPKPHLKLALTISSGPMLR